MTREEFERAVRKLAESSGLDSTEVGQTLGNLADEYLADDDN